MPNWTNDCNKLIAEFDAHLRDGSMTMSESTNHALLITIGKGVFFIAKLLASKAENKEFA